MPHCTLGLIKYAIVDIETTGGYAGHHRITEIAVYHHDGIEITLAYHTLINPERHIPEFITNLTGIDDKMVEHAPTFSDVAGEIHKQLINKVFVAHNAHFDYSFLKKEFEATNIQWAPKKLDTVRLSRKIFPGFRSYSLGRLAESLGITINDRHRAQGDAQATATIFDLLLKNDEAGIITKSLRRNSGETILPPNLSKETYDQLPAGTGVYYFWNGRGQVIYVGKAVNIKKRISGHFSGVAREWNRSNIRNEIQQITFEQTGNELIALLLEAAEIQRLWPRYNLAQKSKRDIWGVIRYEDQLGYQRLSITKIKKEGQPLITFSNKGDAWNYLWEKVHQFELCPRLSGLQQTKGLCHSYQTGSCKGACQQIETATMYNKRLIDAVNSFHTDEESFLVVGTGRKRGEKSAVLIEQGKYVGYGYINSRRRVKSVNTARKAITPAKNAWLYQNIINSFLVDPRDQEIIPLG